jgi:hypothetical protein
MKLTKSTAIAFTLALTSTFAPTAAVFATSVSGDSTNKTQAVSTQDQIESGSGTGARNFCFYTPIGLVCQ